MTSAGFEQGPDFLQVRLAFDIPADGLSTLREITQEIDRFRTSVESAGRSQDDFVAYLDRMTEASNRAAAAQQNLSGVLQRQQEYSTRMMTGSTGTPPPPQGAGYPQPWQGRIMGTGRMATTVPEAAAQAEALATGNPRAYLNAQAAWGGLGVGDLAGVSNAAQVQETAQRIAARESVLGSGSALSQKIAQYGGAAMAMSGRGAAMGMLGRSLSGGLRPSGAASPAPDEDDGGFLSSIAGGMGLGGLGKGVGAAGLGIGGGLAAFGLSQKIGEMYQGYKAMGLTRGGGAAEGLGYEMGIRTMAMNPFISTEQARAIVQQGLKDGYTGKEFDTMTQFMASNLKDMNIDVATSADLLRKNVHEGGQSIASLNEQLAQLKDLSKTGARSLPELVQGYEKTTQTLIGMGMPGAQAGRAAEIAGQWFVGEQALAGTGEDLINAMVTNPTAQAMLMTQGGLNIPPGTLPGEVPFMVEPEALAQGSFNVIKKYALQLWQANGKPAVGTPRFYRAVYLWSLYLQQLGINWDQTQIKSYFTHIIKGEDPNVEANKRVEESTQERAQIQSRGTLSQMVAGVGGFFGGIGSVIGDIFNGGEFTPGADMASENWGANAAYIPSLDEAVQGLGGPGGVEVLDENGNPQKLTGSREQLEKLQSGQFKIRPRGGQSAGVTVNQISSMSSADEIANFMKSGTVPMTGEVTIGLRDDAAKYFTVTPNPVKLSPHEQQSMSGYGNTALNNAPPGWNNPRARYG